MSSSPQEKPRVAVVGYGNIGRYAVEALLAAPDLELAGVIRRDPQRPPALPGDIPVVADLADLPPVAAALLCTPSRTVAPLAAKYLAQGVHTVDSYDEHGVLVDMKRDLDEVARAHGRTAIIAAGWDPGTDSMVRALFEVMAPQGVTITSFGPGTSMGHSTLVRNLPGVQDALSITLPVGDGSHRRLVYVQLEPGAELAQVEQAIKSDRYFKNDETRVVAVPSVDGLLDLGHGVEIQRKGVSGQTHNQRFTFAMQIQNPALTAQIMVAAARACLRQQPGAYTMLEVPLIDFLPGDRDELLRRLV